MNLKVLLVDDHTLVRKGFRALLLIHYPHWEISEAGNGVEAILACSSMHFDIILMDHDMPKLDGLTAARQILRASPGVRILMVSMHSGEDLSRNLREAGVMGIVRKNVGDGEFLLALGRIRNGMKYFPESTCETDPDLQEKVSSVRCGLGGNGLELLTTREAEIFRLLASGESTATIAGTLSISTKTLDTHKMSIFRKCGVHSLPELVRFAFLNNAV